MVLGVGKAAISDAKNRGVLPAAWFLKLSRPPHNLNPLWLETGDGEMLLSSGGNSGCNRVAEVGWGDDYVRPLQVRPVPDRTGGGLEASTVRPVYAFGRDWLEGKGNVAGMRLMRISGDSMHPTLCDKDMVLVDETQKDIFEGKIYVIRIDGQIVVKRMGKKPGKLILISDNRERYEPLDVSSEQEQSIEIIGMIVWMGREGV